MAARDECARPELTILSTQPQSHPRLPKAPAPPGALGHSALNQNVTLHVSRVPTSPEYTSRTRSFQVPFSASLDKLTV